MLSQLSVSNSVQSYQVLSETVQPRVLDFPSLLDYHEGEDTEKSCNLEHLI